MSPCLVRILMQKVELAGRQRARKHRHPLHRGRYSRSLAGRKVLRSLWSTFRHWYWCGCLYRWSNRFDCRRKCSHALCGSSHMRPWMWSRCKQYAIVSVRDLPSKKTRKIHELVERDGRPWICAHRLGLLLFSYVAGQASWRLIFACQYVGSIVLIAAAFILPSSPRWLGLKGRDAECLATLAKLHGKRIFLSI